MSSSHTQRGNNNAYCQDNELTWLNWNLDDEQKSFLEFVRTVTKLWRSHPVFQRRRFFQGRGIRGSGIKDISWFDPSGKEMSDEAWGAGFVRCLGVGLAGDLVGDLDAHGEPVTGDTMLLLLNAHHESISFAFPTIRGHHTWERILDTAETGADRSSKQQEAQYPLQGRSLAVFRLRREEAPRALSTKETVEHLSPEPLPAAAPAPAPELAAVPLPTAVR